MNIERRLQYALQGFSQDTFYYGAERRRLYDPALAPYHRPRPRRRPSQSQRGGTAFAIYPFNRYRARRAVRRATCTCRESYNEPDAAGRSAISTSIEQYGQPLFRNGNMLPFGVAFVQETTVFREYGPVAGQHVAARLRRVAAVRRQLAVAADARRRRRATTRGSAPTACSPFRLRGLKSWGNNPDFLYFGGNSEMRGYDYLQFIGQKAFFADAELRFPLIEAMLTPLGVARRPARRVLRRTSAARASTAQPFTFLHDERRRPYTPIVGYSRSTRSATSTPVYGPPVRRSRGFRLVDGRASYGFGLESFLLGFPMHFDWSWKTLFNKRLGRRALRAQPAASRRSAR